MASQEKEESTQQGSRQGDAQATEEEPGCCGSSTWLGGFYTVMAVCSVLSFATAWGVWWFTGTGTDRPCFHEDGSLVPLCWSKLVDPTNAPYDGNFKIVAALSAAMFIVSLLGIYSSVTKGKTDVVVGMGFLMLMTSFTLLAFSILMLVGAATQNAGLMDIPQKMFDKLQEKYVESLKAASQETDGELIQKWDAMQEKFHCCGVSSYEDWTTYGQGLPSSCVTIEEKDQDLPSTGCWPHIEEEITRVYFGAWQPGSIIQISISGLLLIFSFIPLCWACCCKAP